MGLLNGTGDDENCCWWGNQLVRGSGAPLWEQHASGPCMALHENYRVSGSSALRVHARRGMKITVAHVMTLSAIPCLRHDLRHRVCPRRVRPLFSAHGRAL